MKPTTKPPLKTSPTRAIYYARVSSDSQVDNTSIGDQVDRGKAFTVSQGWSLGRIFIDGGESGKSTDRGAFQEMISYLKDNPVDVLLVFKLDRLFRNLKDMLIFIDDELENRNIALQSVTENFNTQSPEGRLFLQLLGSFAEFERKRINERCMSGKVATAKRGKWNGGHIPYGYRRSEVGQYEFDIHTEEAKIVKQIFKLYSQGFGFIKIKRITKCPLSIQGISDLLKNPFYIGKVQFNDIIENNNHLKIISERIFKKCQKIRKNKHL